MVTEKLDDVAGNGDTVLFYSFLHGEETGLRCARCSELGGRGQLPDSLQSHPLPER